MHVAVLMLLMMLPIAECLDISPMVIDLGDIGVRQATSDIRFKVHLSGQGTCISKSECGCVVVRQDGEEASGDGIDFAFAGIMHFGEAKGMIERRITLSVNEGGIDTVHKVVVRATVQPVCEIIPGAIMEWHLSEETAEHSAELLFVPSIHVRKVTIVETPEDFTAKLSKADAQGLSWTLRVAPKLKMSKSKPVPQTLRIAIESDTPRLAEKSFYLSIDPDPQNDSH